VQVAANRLHAAGEPQLLEFGMQRDGVGEAVVDSGQQVVGVSIQLPGAVGG
jgi:hypothetical protein